MSIDFRHPEYKENINQWNLVDNVCDSKDVEQHLITLNPNDTSKENSTRNKQYKERAVFYAVAGYTLQGLIGLLFSKPPTVELPSQLEYMKTNVNGAGVSIYQQAQDASAETIKKGRNGLFVSYPKTEGAVSVADMNEGGYVATINQIDAGQIINWGVKLKGSKVVLSLVVLSEVAEVIEDYEIKEVKQIKELALKDDVFTVINWRKDEKDEWVVFDETIPTDATGKTWSEIPFTFIGSQANTTAVDGAPLYPLAKINIAHYRNSADYEDSVWYVGQAQPWMSGINQNHIDLMKDNDMYFGSRQLFGVPTGETLGIAAAPPNTMVKEAMDGKLEMMIGLGARFVQEGGTVKTATEDSNDAKVEHSVLSTISTNVSEAYTQALQWASQYMGSDGDIVFETSQEFVSPTATAQELQQMVAGFVQGAIPMGSYFRWLKKVDLVDAEKTLEDFSEEISKVDMPNLNDE